MDGSSRGQTQLYIPSKPPVNVPNVNFGLSHRVGQAAVMLNGRAYFIGVGMTIFNPSTNTSTIGAPLNVARWLHAATVVNNTIIVCGGYNDGPALSSCEQYTPSNQTWNMIMPLPVIAGSGPMVTLNNRAYSFGRSGNCGPSPPPIYMFDGQNWVTRSSISGLPYYVHAGIALDTDRALICGGLAYKAGLCQFGVSDCFIYSASSDSWTTAAPMSQGRCKHSMVMFEGETFRHLFFKRLVSVSQIAGQIYIFGNCSGDKTVVENYNPVTGSTILATRIVGNAFMAAVAIEQSTM
jgi:hypothetical protein